MDNNDCLFRIVISGMCDTGKSSMLLRFVDNEFNDSYLPTIAADFKMKMFEIEGKIIKLLVWDISGQERFKYFISL